MDIIDIPLLNADPRHHQVENYVIDAGRWVKRGEISWNELEQLRDRPGYLWINRDSTNPGLYDCISQAEAATIHDSLGLSDQIISSLK